MRDRPVAFYRLLADDSIIIMLFRNGWRDRIDEYFRPVVCRTRLIR